MAATLAESSFIGPATPLPRAPDLAIIGGGVVGLWCAERAARAGLKTVLFEKHRLGQGASGGFLGALMPHQPVSWTPEKAFQLAALLSLERDIARLQDETEVYCDYLRCGRLIPTRTEKKRAERLVWQAAANANWPAGPPGGKPIGWTLLDAPPDARWLAPDAAPLGCEFDTLSARLNPRQLIAALAKRARETAHIREEAEVASLGDGSRLTLADGTEITPGRVILTAGYQSFAMLQSLTGRKLGRGVKGQSALLKPRRPVDPGWPILYFGGVYVIAHGGGLIAVGSTSEKSFAHPSKTTSELDGLINRAREICPALDGAEIIERWASVRPNAVGRHPVLGPLPEAPRVIVATGGFKISFGIAHKMADIAIEFASGYQPELPSSFDVQAHYDCAANRR